MPAFLRITNKLRGLNTQREACKAKVLLAERLHGFLVMTDTSSTCCTVPQQNGLRLQPFKVANSYSHLFIACEIKFILILYVSAVFAGLKCQVYSS